MNKRNKMFLTIIPVLTFVAGVSLACSTPILAPDDSPNANYSGATTHTPQMKAPTVSPVMTGHVSGGGGGGHIN